MYATAALHVKFRVQTEAEKRMAGNTPDIWPVRPRVFFLRNAATDSIASNKTRFL
jgi:hypothetical protein